MLCQSIWYMYRYNRTIYKRILISKSLNSVRFRINKLLRARHRYSAALEACVPSEYIIFPFMASCIQHLTHLLPPYPYLCHHTPRHLSKLIYTHGKYWLKPSYITYLSGVGIKKDDKLSKHFGSDLKASAIKAHEININKLSHTLSECCDRFQSIDWVKWWRSVYVERVGNKDRWTQRWYPCNVMSVWDNNERILML